MALLLAALPAVGGAQSHVVTVHSFASAATGDAGTTSLSVPFTMPTNGTGRATYVCKHPALVVGVSVLRDAGDAPAISSVVWDPDPPGGTTYSLELQDVTAGNSNPTGDNRRKRTEIWLRTTQVPSVLNPIPAGSGRIVLTWATTAEVVAGVVLACGVDQPNPRVGGTVGDAGSVAGNSATIGLASVADGLTVDVLAVEGNVSVTGGFPTRPNRWNVVTGNTANDLRGFGSSYGTSALFTILNYMIDIADHWVMAAVAVRPAALTAAGVGEFQVLRRERGARASWFAPYDPQNLGYRLWRQRGALRTLLTPELVAGSFLLHGDTPLAAGHPYAWDDPEGLPGDLYELEAVTLDGRGELVARGQLSGRTVRRTLGGPSPTLGTTAGAMGAAPRLRPYVPTRNGPGGPDAEEVQFWLAGQPAVKLGVKASGWYRVPLARLKAAGLRFTSVDLPRLALYADGRQVAAKVHLASSGSVLDRESYLEFWGEAQDTPQADTRVYWAVVGNSPAARMATAGAGATGAQGELVTFTGVSELQERLVYVPAVLNGAEENFFGRPLTASGVTYALATPHAVEGKARLTVRVQGVTADQHRLEVALNGHPLGVVSGEGEGRHEAVFELAGSLLRPGADNQLTITGRSAQGAVALMDTLTLTYPRTSRASGDELFLPAGSFAPPSRILLGGFRESGARAFEVTDPYRPVELTATQVRDGEWWGIGVDIPGGGSSLRTPKAIFAVAADRLLAPAWVRLNRPSQLHAPQHGADVLYLTRAELAETLEPLLDQRRSQGLVPLVVDLEDVYDEFSHGTPTREALRAFLQRATTVWQRKPAYVVLVGDGSYDPRDYLGKGGNLVPVALVDTSVFETASDDWFGDFDGDGVAEVAIGRLPAANAGELAVMVGKILRFEAAARTPLRALLVADEPLAEAFSLANERLATFLPAGSTIIHIQVEREGVAGARTRLFTELSQGYDLVHYFGHGTVDRWRHGVLTTADAPALPVTTRVPLFTMANCLNGIFQEPLLVGLGEELLRSPGGPALVWASTGSTRALAQEALMTQFVSALAQGSGVRAGDAVRAAKGATTDADVRSTWVLLGDPAMPLR